MRGCPRTNYIFCSRPDSIHTYHINNAVLIYCPVKLYVKQKCKLYACNPAMDGLWINHQPEEFCCREDPQSQDRQAVIARNM